MRLELSVKEFCYVLRANALEDPADSETVTLLLRILDWFIDRDPSDLEFQRLLYARLADPSAEKATSRRVCQHILDEWRARDLDRPFAERQRYLRARLANTRLPYADRTSINRLVRRQRRGV